MKKKISKVSGIEIQLIKGIYERNNFHPEVEIIFVMSGKINVAIKDDIYELNDKDIILVNSNIMHNIESIESSLICRIYISYKVLSQFIDDGNYNFSCNSAADNNHSYVELRSIIKRIAFTYLEEKRKTECLRYGLVYELLDNLIENFQSNDKHLRYKKGQKENEQLQYIINYVNLNFQNSIHLSEIAEEMYTSTSTLSRFFKKQYGIYFGDFVNKVRLSYAVKDLIETDKRITKIAGDCGFSNASIFSKTFQNEYKMSPSAYRKMKQEEAENLDKIEAHETEDLKKEIMIFQKNEEDKAIISKECNIEVDTRKTQNYKKFWNSVLNVGRAHNLILANVQEQVLYLVEQLKFEYIRIWNLFSKDLMIQRTNNDFNYNFNMVDNILDFIVNNGVKPFIDFGKKPDCAVKGEEGTVYYEEEYLEFKSIKEWQNMFQSFVSHVIKRYGKDEVTKWKFEFSLDVRPNRFYVSDRNESYEELFEESYKFLKKKLQAAEVGGFGATINVNDYKVSEWLKYCREKECIPDFISVLAFPYTQETVDGRVVTKRTTKEDEMIAKIHEMRKKLDKEGFEKCKLFITECNNSLSSRNYLNDSCFRAAYIIKKVEELWDTPDIMSLWMGLDLVSSYYDTARIANGGSGIITKDKIRKPIYYSFEFLNRMCNKFIDKGSNYIITSNGMNSFYVLCFNYKDYSCDYYMKDEDNLELSKMDSLFENEDDLKLKINLNKMPENQRFIIKNHIVNGEHGSILNEWAKFQYEKDIEGRDLKYLSEVCIPEITMEKKCVYNGRLSLETTMKKHEILLIHIYEEH